MKQKIVVVVLAAGMTAAVHAGFGDFLKKAAAVTDAVTGTSEASSTVNSGQQTASAIANPGAAVQSAAVAPAVPDTAVPGEVNDIDMDELAKRLKADSSLLLIDVRSAGEFASGHIPHAKNIPVDVIGEKIGRVASNKETPVYVYCRSGARASTAAATLVSKGYRRVYNAGGISDWSGKVAR